MKSRTLIICLFLLPAMAAARFVIARGARTIGRSSALLQPIPVLDRRIGAIDLKFVKQSIRHALPDGAGPAVPHATSWNRHTVGTELRVYDLRDLSNRAAFTVPPVERHGSIVRKAKHYEGRDALEVMLYSTVDRPSWWYACGIIGRAEWLGDKLIVEQTPEDQEKIRRVLSDARAGTAIPGMEWKANGNQSHQ
jgi:hypothetical protein